VVLPAYNEEASITQVLEEWLPTLRQVAGSFRLLVIDDGSRDGTLAILRDWERCHPEITVRHQANAGHGQTCLRGYQAALEAGAPWVLQIDSDGQCDPAYLPSFWARREDADAVLGLRAVREDGAFRWLVSRAVSLVVLLGLGVWVPDPNVPYRLVRARALASAVEAVPPDFHLINVLVAARLRLAGPILWVPIRFRRRHGGRSSASARFLLSQGLRLYRQLRALRPRDP
jgi:glycosyltransferase involved in cell wall biosynthesis